MHTLRRPGRARDTVAVLYIAQVLLFFVIAPITATAIDVATTGHGLVAAGTFWFVFFGGVRLLIAGISQAANPAFTVHNILGQKDPNPGANHLAQELGYANLGLGALGVVGPWLGWAPAGALAMGVFLVIAGLRHVAKRGKGAKEWVATVTDLAFGAVLLLAFVLAVIPA